MAREPVRPVNRRKPAAEPRPVWLWLLLGLIPGLLIALLVYLGGYTAGDKRLADSFLPHADTTPASSPRKVVVDTREVRKAPAVTMLPPPPAVSPPVSATAPKPRFDFYTILPEMEVAVPEKEISGKPEQGVAQVKKPGTYALQAGSFKAFSEADRLKASLVLLGIEASIQTVTVNNKDTWYRVHIGPYKDLSELNEIRARLKQNKIDAVLLRLKA